MALHPLAGKPAPAEALIDVAAQLDAFHDLRPDPENPAQRVAFGTSGHRGRATDGSFNQDHVAAIVQAICESRKREGIQGPLFLGMDTHALSGAAHAVALEVLSANGIETRIQEGGGYVPTPAISLAILGWRRDRGTRADGIIITPSHNPPEDGGIKYNPPHGGPAGSDHTRAIADRANALLEGGLSEVKRRPLASAGVADSIRSIDYVNQYVDALSTALELDPIRDSGLRIGADPMGGAALDYWPRIAERFGLNIEIVNPMLDPQFGFMPLDHDGRIRMDCSSKHAMARLIDARERFDIAMGNDPDADRHGIVTRSGGLMNPNHFLAVAVDYLFRERSGWPQQAAVGKTLVSSGLIDRVAASLGRKLVEVPVGFKHFVPGLLSGELGFGGEESAGASFLRKDGNVWTTDKDGILLGLLAAEIRAVTGRDPFERYREIADALGEPCYARRDAPATAAQKAALTALGPEDLGQDQLAGEAIERVLTHASGNGEPIGGLKVETRSGWFAARPSGTEALYKIYAESFAGPEHLALLQEEAQALVDGALSRPSGGG
jgi:phosphoglucomutase